MEKDVDEVKKTAHYIKTKVEEVDKEVRSLLNLFLCFIQYLDSCYELPGLLPCFVMCCRIWQIGRSQDAEKDQLLTGQEQQRPCQ